MPAPRSVTLALKAGRVRAVLPAPDHRTMKQGTNYTVSWEVFTKIDPKARASVIDVVSFNTTAGAKDGTSLATNSATVPAGLDVGEVKEGTALPDAFMLVKLVDAVAATAGTVLTWANKKRREVTADRVGGSDGYGHEVAGAAVGAITAGNYGWIQFDGETTVRTATGTVAAGDLLAPDPTTDGQAREATGTDEPFAVAVAGEVASGTVGVSTVTAIFNRVGDKPRHVRNSTSAF